MGIFIAQRWDAAAIIRAHKASENMTAANLIPIDCIISSNPA